LSITIQQLLANASVYLPRSTTPKLDVEILLCNVLKASQAYLYTHGERELTVEEKNSLEKLIARRQAGEPIAYIVGEKEFFSLNLKVNSDVLVPRPDTELLVELALQLLPQEQAANVVDLGTGSGAVALAIAHQRPVWQVYASDVSSEALVLAKENAKHLQLSHIHFLQSDWCSALPDVKFDLIVSNPPYVDAMDAHLQADELQFEPRSALVAGDGGYADLFVIADQAGAFLSKGGWLLLEHGFEQGKKLANYLRKKGFSRISGRVDLAGLTRVTLAQY
jgi:release factor glutamine methyltransferase